MIVENENVQNATHSPFMKAIAKINDVKEGILGQTQTLTKVAQSEVGKNGNAEKRLSNEINTEFHESSASVTRDKKKIYFTRNNFINGKIGTDRNKQINLKIYTAESEDGENWGGIKELPFNDDNYSVAHPTLSVDEKKLYFSSDMPGTFG